MASTAFGATVDFEISRPLKNESTQSVENAQPSSPQTRGGHHDVNPIVSLPSGEVPSREGPSRPPQALHGSTPPPLGSMSEASGGPQTATDPERTGSNPPRTPHELETNGSLSSLRPDDAVNVVQSWKDPAMNKWRILSACVVCFANGCNDSAPGALIPYIEQYYHINYATVAIIFLTNALGFITAAFFVHALDLKLGRSRTLMLCEAINVVGFVIAIVPPPYPLFAIFYFFTGYGQATGLALNNVFCANVSPATVVLGMFHGSYGIGGLLAPIIATTMVTHGVLFSRFFGVLLGVRMVSLIASGYAFWHFERDGKASGANPDIPLFTRNDFSEDTATQPTTPATSPSGTFLVALKNRTTLIASLFIFAYQGAEVSISGWAPTYLITQRSAPAAQVGYVTAGFWGGVMLGRFTLVHLAQRVGERVFTSAMVCGAIIFEAVVWRWGNVVGDAVFIALIGYLLGPIYPAATTVFTKLLPRSLQASAFASIFSAGSAGGAAAPFMTGLLAQKFNPGVLHPVALGCYAVMVGCWISLPRVERKRE